MAVPSPLNPINYLINRQYVETLSIKKELFTRRLAKATNLFRKDLLSHYGCVNAIEFSNEGELLISGGDDRRVLLWSVPHAILDRGQPVVMLTPHLSNIFCLGFDSTNSKIFSAGNDDQVIVHDAKTGYLLTNFLHEKPVYGLSISPQNDNVFASAGEDGRILIYDIREPSTTDPLCLVRYKTAFHAVMFNPIDPRFVATANTEEGIALWDNRKPREHVIRYGNGIRQNSGMSVRFNSLGTQLLALRRRLPPVLYSAQSDKPICQFYHPDYYNSCTMKSCSFAGENDEYVLSGSDDFNLYMWKIPEDNSEWGPIHIVLLGHRSIVNQVRYNKQNNLIASSGVEKMVKLWSTLPVGGWKGSLLQTTPDKPRQVFSHEEYISLVQNNGQLVSHDYSHQSTSEDSRMMAFFDSLVQREIEGWVISDETLTSDSDYDSSSNLNYLSQVPPDSNRIFSSDKKGNRIAQLIYEKREKLAKMAQQKYSSSHRYKKREKQRKRKSSKLKSSCLKLSSKKSSSGYSRKTSNKHHNSKFQSTSSQPSCSSVDNNRRCSGLEKDRTDKVATTAHKHKYKTRSNSARSWDKEEFQSSESLDVPSTSTGITASSSVTNSVYRIYDQDSDDETTTANGPNNIQSPEPNDQAQPLINILPTPLNGTHDMYINILQVPVNNTNGVNGVNGVITVENSENLLNSDSSNSVSSDLETIATPNGKFNNFSDALTPDSGIVTGPCSSTTSINSVYSSSTGACSSTGTSVNRHLHLRHHIDDNSDDPDWALENFKKRVKRARFNLKNFGCDSDSN